MTPRHTPAGPLASARAAADLTGMPRPELDDLIRRGAVRTERIGGKLYVDLDDAERAAKATREGGAG
jgi:hypothetical protein